MVLWHTTGSMGMKSKAQSLLSLAKDSGIRKGFSASDPVRPWWLFGARWTIILSHIWQLHMWARTVQRSMIWSPLNFFLNKAPSLHLSVDEIETKYKPLCLASIKTTQDRNQVQAMLPLKWLSNLQDTWTKENLFSIFFLAVTLHPCMLQCRGEFSKCHFLHHCLAMPENAGLGGPFQWHNGIV